MRSGAEVILPYEPIQTAPPYDPESVPVPDPLLEKYTDFFPPAVIKVTDGVYVARGYNREIRC